MVDLGEPLDCESLGALTLRKLAASRAYANTGSGEIEKRLRFGARGKAILNGARKLSSRLPTGRNERKSLRRKKIDDSVPGPLGRSTATGP
jgi:hypothetical protein